MTTSKTYQPSELTLVAASREQAKVTRQNTFPYWGAPRGFTMEKYVERDEIMEQEEWGADHFLITWVLVPCSNTTTTTEILSHCETYRRAAVLLPPSSPSSDTVEVQDVVAYGIASVYTPPVFRKRGYGKQMLQLLHYVLAPLPSLPPFPSHLWGSLPPSPPAGRSQDASFAVLYSDIGREFYKNCTQGEGESARLGWVEGGSVGRFWVLNPEENGKEKEGTEWLERKGVKAFEEDMSQRMLKRFREGGGPGDRGRTRVAFLPTGGLLSLHPLRSLLSDPPTTHIRSFGFSFPPHSPTSSDRPTATYTFTDEAKPHQTLLLTHVSGPVPFSAVVAAARREGCDRIEVWGDDDVSRSWRDKGGKEGLWCVRGDNEHLASLVQYGGGEGELEWVYNEKYAWC